MMRLYRLGFFAACLLHGIPLALVAQRPPVAPSTVLTLSGVVVDNNGMVVPLAEVTVLQNGRIVAVVKTDTTGAFNAGQIPAGSTDIRARRLGYKLATMNLDIDASLRIQIVMQVLVTTVAPVVVEAGGKLSAFYEHRNKGSLGIFFDRDEIEKRRIRFSSELFRTVPGATVRSSPRFGNLLRFHGCKPRIWLDGVPLLDAELDEVLRPEEIAGIEIYSVSPAAPAQYMDARGCGTIVVWTRV